MPNNSGNISQSNSGSMSGGMQAAIGNNNQQMMSNEVLSDSNNVPTKAEVVDIITEVENMIGMIAEDTELSEEVRKKAKKILHYLGAAKVEVESEEPDKQLVSSNLERFTKNLEEVDKTVDTSKRLSEKVIPLILKVANWLGAAAGSLWVMLK